MDQIGDPGADCSYTTRSAVGEISHNLQAKGCLGTEARVKYGERKTYAAFIPAWRS